MSRQDGKSQYKLITVIAAASQAVSTVNSLSVDHAEAGSVSFSLSVGTVGASSTIDAKTQYSEDNATWTDYPANDEAKNDDAIVQITVAGSAELHVTNPRARYSRVVTTVGTAASVLCVTAFLGPLRHVAA